MAEIVKSKGGRPPNPKNDGDLQKLLKGYAAKDVPEFRKRLRDIALGKVKDSQYDPKSGTIVDKAVPLSVCVDAINCYGKNILAKIVGDVKAETNINVNHKTTVDDAASTVEKRKREEKQKLEKDAREAGKLAKITVGGEK
jgi:hypothetical protein